MSWLDERRTQEHARSQANYWAAGLGGRSSLPRPMPQRRRSKTSRHPIIVTPGGLPAEPLAIPARITEDGIDRLTENGTPRWMEV